MPSVLNEQTQFTDTAGKPLVSGKAYFGDQGADPKLNPVSIFSDRELTTPLSNPQTLDANGRTTNKVWLAGRYSIRIDDRNGAQKYQELDNGESPDVGVTSLENVAGANAITATATRTISAYEDQEQYTFRIVQANTDAVTLNIDTVGVTSVVKNHDQPIQPGDFEVDQNVIVSRNSTDDTFEWVNQNIKSVSSYSGTDIADSAAPTVPTDGNYFEALGATTRTSYVVAANRVWTEKTIGARTYTASASIVTINGNDLILVADETVTFQSTAANIVQVVATSAAGGALRSVQVFTSSGTWTKPAGINSVRVQLVGGGGGGAGCVDTGNGSGGGAGGYAEEFIDVTGTASETVTIGPLGAGGAAGANNGVAGGATSLGALLSATGGAGGITGTDQIGGAGGSGSGGDINLDGGPGGGSANGAAVASAAGGIGGASYFGGSTGVNKGGGAQAAAVNTGGGGGGSTGWNGAESGSVGGSGIVIVWEYS